MDVVDRIRKAADFRGVKYGKICALFGESSGYLGAVQRGLRKLDDNRIHAIADFLGVNYSYLTGESEVMLPGAKDLNYRRKHDGEPLYPEFDYKRFFARCQEQKIGTEDLESQMDLPRGFFVNSEKEDYQFSEDFINEIAACLNTTYEYLTDQTDDSSPARAKGVKIKVFGEVAAGIPIEQIDNFDPDDPNDWEEIDLRTARGGEYFALRVKGDSMEPRMFDGDIVIVRYQQTIEDGEIAIIAINGDTATCKRVRIDTNGIYLLPLNNKYIPKFYSNEEIENLPVTILGKVVEVRGKL